MGTDPHYERARALFNAAAERVAAEERGEVEPRRWTPRDTAVLETDADGPRLSAHARAAQRFPAADRYDEQGYHLRTGAWNPYRDGGVS